MQFRRELAAMTLLSQHRNVLPLLGACVQPDLAALVTPYCPRSALPPHASIYSSCILLSASVLDIVSVSSYSF